MLQNDTVTPHETGLHHALDDSAQTHITLGELIQRIGMHGMYTMCIALALPFVFPIAIPGLSTVFGAIIVLAGISAASGRPLWLPRRIAQWQIPRAQLMPILLRAERLITRLRRLAQPRFSALTGTRAARVNGTLMIIAGIFVMLPLGLIPLSNTLPAIGTILLSIGMLQRDGLFISGGALFVLLTVFYMGSLALGAGTLVIAGIDALQTPALD
jgi:hypothetical protein